MFLASFETKGFLCRPVLTLEHFLAHRISHRSDERAIQRRSTCQSHDVQWVATSTPWGPVLKDLSHYLLG
jgi:hypothetical protein